MRANCTIKETVFRVEMARRGYRQMKEVAAAARMSPDRLSHVVGGRRVGNDTAERLAKALKVPVTRLFTVEDRTLPVQTDLPIDDAQGAS